MLAGVQREKPGRGFEPLTLALQERRSGQLSYPGGKPQCRPGRAARQTSATETAASSEPCPFEEYGIGGGSSAPRSLISASRPPSTRPTSACRHAAWANARPLPLSEGRSLRAGWTRSITLTSGHSAKCSASPAASPASTGGPGTNGRTCEYTAPNPAPLPACSASPAAGHESPRVTSLPSSSTSS